MIELFQRFQPYRNLKMIWPLIGVGLTCYGILHTLILMLIDCDLQLFFCEKLGKSVRRLKGKVVFITGASSGIGEHTAIALAKHGVKLVLTARRQTELERVKQVCLSVANGKLTDKDILVLPMDVVDYSSQNNCFEAAVNHFGSIDILFNNAGRSQRAKFDDIELSVDKDMFELNVFSVLNLTRIALEHFNKRGQGHIVVTSSVAGFLKAPNSSTYSATKYALHGYFNALRIEKMKQNIYVTLLCPGPTYTNFLQNCYTAKEGETYGVKASPKDRRMSAERCGELCAISVANKCSESWMGVFPLIPFIYFHQYFPLLYNILLRTVGPDRVYGFRDGPKQELVEGKKTG